MATRCICSEPAPGAFFVCKRCGGEYQRTHSSRCDCAACNPEVVIHIDGNVHNNELANLKVVRKP